MSVRHPSRRRSVIALALLAVVALAMGLVVWANRDAPEPVPPPTPTASPTVAPLEAEPTLLVQVRDDTFTNVGNVLVALADDGSGAQLYLPHSLAMAAVGNRQETLGATGAAPIQQAPDLVAAQTGVRTDGALVLDRLAFAGLVDAVGGIQVDVPATIAFVDRAGTTLAVIPAGSQTLDGPEAALYATYRTPGAPPEEQYLRFQQAWNAVLPLLPDSVDRMRAILGSLGALARSTQSIAPLAEFLTDAGETARAAQWRSDSIAVRPGAIGPLPIFWVDAGAAATQVQSLMPAAVTDPALQPVRVRVYAAGATISEVAELAAQSDAQVTYVWSGPFFPLTDSQVVVADERFLATGRRVAATAGVIPAVVSVDPNGTPGAPVTVFYAGPQVLEPPDELAVTPGVSSS